MKPVVNQSGAHALAASDPCKSLGPPVPYPNIALFAQAQITSKKVLIQALPVFTLGDQIPLSAGNEASAPFGGGVVSGMVKGATRATAGSAKVFVMGMPVVAMGAATLQNGTNAPGSVVGVPQAAVLIS